MLRPRITNVLALRLDVVWGHIHVALWNDTWPGARREFRPSAALLDALRVTAAENGGLRLRRLQGHPSPRILRCLP
jgi:hypothetical protein